MDGEAVRSLLKGLDRVIATRGKKVLVFEQPERRADEVLEVALGRSGTLRAPTLRLGKTLIVGYSEELYREHFG